MNTKRQRVAEAKCKQTEWRVRYHSRRLGQWLCARGWTFLSVTDLVALGRCNRWLRLQLLASSTTYPGLWPTMARNWVTDMTRLYPSATMIVPRAYRLVDGPATTTADATHAALATGTLTLSTLKAWLAADGVPLERGWLREDPDSATIGELVVLEQEVTVENAPRFGGTRETIVKLTRDLQFDFSKDEPQFVTRNIQLLPGDEKMALLDIDIHGRMTRFATHYIDVHDDVDGLAVEIGEATVQVDADRSGALDVIRAVRRRVGPDIVLYITEAWNHTN